jgi:alpha-tubulin suppressor-like RCC1 family protein
LTLILFGITIKPVEREGEGIMPLKKKEIVTALIALMLFSGLANGLFGQAPDGTIWAWGSNNWGHCTVPAPNSEFIAISSGDWHSLGLKSDGSIVAWGHYPYGDNGQCNVPAPNSDFVAVSAGGYHSLGLKSDGSVVAWGFNAYGQCNVPTPNSGFIAIAAGGYHSLGLKSDGSVVAWGYNLKGQLSIPGPNSDFVAVSGGGYHSLGLRSDGSIAAWGWYPGQDFGECNVPGPNSNFIAVAAGVCHSLGLKSDGTVVAWGRNFDGQCNVPPPNSDFIAIAAGVQHSLGLKSDGTVVAWGWNDYGQCNAPTVKGFVAISAGAVHSLALEGFIFEGFYSPIVNRSTNIVHAGQTIPIKWRITDKDGAPISSPASFISLMSSFVNCESLTEPSASVVDESTAGSSGLQYLGDGVWQFNWKTSKSYSGQCRSLKLTLSDHSEHIARFSFH